MKKTIKIWRFELSLSWCTSIIGLGVDIYWNKLIGYVYFNIGIGILDIGFSININRNKL